MSSNASETRVTFSRLLRAFQTGGVSIEDLLTQLDQQLAAGASAAELLQILRRREYVEPLPDSVHDAVVSRLQRAAAGGADALPESAPAGPPQADVEKAPPEAGGAAPHVELAARDQTTAPMLSPPIDPPASAPTLRDFKDELVLPERRSAWTVRLVGLSVAMLIAIAGWLYFRPQPNVVYRALPPVAAPTPRAAPPLAPRPAEATVADESKDGTVLRDCPACPEMIVLPRGRFKQGSDSDAAGPSERPQHVVSIGYPLAMSINDVTVAEFRAFIAATHLRLQGCDTYDGTWRRNRLASWARPGFAQAESHPVTCASWNDAMAYARWLSATSGHRYRLPSASEWEYAARSGGEAERPWASNGPGACANANVADQSAARRYPGWETFDCDDGYVYTAPVGSFKPNGFGLKDMLGNAFQWTADCWHEDYSGAPADGSARAGSGCREYELRGGSWFSSPRYIRATYRNHFAADYRTSSVGFRVVREMTP